MDDDFSSRGSPTHDECALPGIAVLVVDDDAGIRALLTRMLCCWGYSVDVAAHGVEALRFLAERTYDVILTDIQMPQMDGLSLRRQALAAGHPGCWILMTGASAVELDGSVSCLRKPLRPLELREALAQFVLDSGHPSRCQP